MSRRIHRAELAVTSDGGVLLNAALLDVLPRLELILEAARTQPGSIFIGVSLTPSETRQLRADTAALLPNATGRIIAARIRRTAR